MSLLLLSFFSMCSTRIRCHRCRYALFVFYQNERINIKIVMTYNTVDVNKKRATIILDSGYQFKGMLITEIS